MTTTLEVDGTTFVFNADWQASKYDEWSFFKNKLSKLNAKGVDIVAIKAGRELHLIEVKDYTHPETSSVPLDDLPMTVAEKCRDTLGGLAAARLRAIDAEQQLAKTSMLAGEIRIALHIELVSKRGPLFSPSAVRANLQTKLRAKLKAIDPHARVEGHGGLLGFWDAHRTVYSDQ